MLILIAGATGRVGRELVASARRRGHKVRALGRDASKAPPEQHAELESFIEAPTWYDTDALERAVAGVDAVVCAYTGQPQLQLEGQLLLLRAAERAGVRRFVCDTWNYDWRTLALGEVECYDPLICFRHHAAISSSVKPIYVLTGMLTDVFFGGDFHPRYGGSWDDAEKRAELWGTGHEKWNFTSYRDAAEYTVEIVQSDAAEDGGFYPVCSATMSPRELLELYQRVRGVTVPIETLGTIDELRDEVARRRAKTAPQDYYNNIPMLFQLTTLSGKWLLTDLANDKFPASCRTSMEDFFRQHPEY